MNEINAMKDAGSMISEVWLIKAFTILPKVIAAIVGALLALVLSGDIDKDGYIKIRRGVVLRFSLGVGTSLFGGSYIIETYGMGHLSSMAQGSVFLLTAVFGLLSIGVLYQAIEMMKGKTLSQIALEVSSAFKAIFRKGIE
jgi:predicted cation transporter